MRASATVSEARRVWHQSEVDTEASPIVVFYPTIRRALRVLGSLNVSATDFTGNLRLTWPPKSLVNLEPERTFKK